MIGFKQYLLTSFSLLIEERINSYLLQVIGENLLLFAEEESFFKENGKDLSLEEGARKTYNLYGVSGSPYKNLVLFDETLNLGFKDALEFGQDTTTADYGLKQKKSYKYYELAADYLKQNNLVAFDSPFLTTLGELFYQRLYLFKKELSLTTDMLQSDSFLGYLNYCKEVTESNKTLYEEKFSKDIILGGTFRSYVEKNLVPKIEDLNDIIDKNLISVVEGAQ